MEVTELRQWGARILRWGLVAGIGAGISITIPYNLRTLSVGLDEVTHIDAGVWVLAGTLGPVISSILWVAFTRWIGRAALAAIFLFVDAAAFGVGAAIGTPRAILLMSALAASAAPSWVLLWRWAQNSGQKIDKSGIATSIVVTATYFVLLGLLTWFAAQAGRHHGEALRDALRTILWEQAALAAIGAVLVLLLLRLEPDVTESGETERTRDWTSAWTSPFGVWREPRMQALGGVAIGCLAALFLFSETYSIRYLQLGEHFDIGRAAFVFTGAAFIGVAVGVVAGPAVETRPALTMKVGALVIVVSWLIAGLGLLATGDLRIRSVVVVVVGMELAGSGLGTALIVALVAEPDPRDDARVTMAQNARYFAQMLAGVLAGLIAGWMAPVTAWAATVAFSNVVAFVLVGIAFRASALRWDVVPEAARRPIEHLNEFRVHLHWFRETAWALFQDGLDEVDGELGRGRVEAGGLLVLQRPETWLDRRFGSQGRPHRENYRRWRRARWRYAPGRVAVLRKPRGLDVTRVGNSLFVRWEASQRPRWYGIQPALPADTPLPQWLRARYWREAAATLLSASSRRAHVFRTNAVGALLLCVDAFVFLAHVTVAALGTESRRVLYAHGHKVSRGLVACLDAFVLLAGVTVTVLAGTVAALGRWPVVAFGAAMTLVGVAWLLTAAPSRSYRRAALRAPGQPTTVHLRVAMTRAGVLVVAALGAMGIGLWAAYAAVSIVDWALALATVAVTAMTGRDAIQARRAIRPWLALVEAVQRVAWEAAYTVSGVDSVDVRVGPAGFGDEAVTKIVAVVVGDDRDAAFAERVRHAIATRLGLAVDVAVIPLRA